MAVQMVGDFGMMRENFCLTMKELFMSGWPFKQLISTSGTFWKFLSQ